MLRSGTLQRAATFPDAFRRTVWATPELDYTHRRPVGALAKQVWSDQRREARDAALARLGLGNAPVPALVLFDTQTTRVLPVGFGVLAENQMAERIFALTALEPGHDY